jgi:hypothetical protein
MTLKGFGRKQLRTIYRSSVERLSKPKQKNVSRLKFESLTSRVEVVRDYRLKLWAVHGEGMKEERRQWKKI